MNRSSEVVTHVQHQAKVHELEVVETCNTAIERDFRGPLCMDCVHASLLRSRPHNRPRQQLAQPSNRHILR